jgi:hypothetical protein
MAMSQANMLQLNYWPAFLGACGCGPRWFPMEASLTNSLANK